MPAPMAVDRTRTTLKKVTHVVCNRDETHFCTSANDVCDVMRLLGQDITPSIVYRLCSRDTRRQRKRPLEGSIRIVRASDYEELLSG